MLVGGHCQSLLPDTCGYSLQEKVREIHNKYVKEDSLTENMEESVRDEYTRLREYLEKQVESLKSKLAKDTKTAKKENRRILQENIMLIR